VNDNGPRHQAARPLTDWRLAAACRDIDPDSFFPAGNASPADAQTARAERICLTCPARTPCLDWAINNRQDYGTRAA
jgi:WhiB family transcriptional regulator, redox-sensing transcriptional regulator